MNYLSFAKAAMLASTIVMAASQNASALTDEMALEDGMTPVELVKSFDFDPGLELDRSEYVTTIPSMEDIERVIKSHRQVIVVNKAAKGAEAQTLKIFENGVVKKLVEKRTTTKVVDGKKIKETVSEEKESVKISTGREKTETAKSGRSYLSTTPKGFFRPTKVYEMYYSNTWKADMPNAVFFIGGIAIHATTESHYAELGTRASGGCVRVRQEVSDQVRKMVMDTGLGSQEGQYGKTTESYRRWLITKNTVSVDGINRNSGDVLNKKLNSWDTVIVVYE